MGIVGKGVIRGHILNCGKLSQNTCIIMLRLSLAKPGNPASIICIILEWTTCLYTSFCGFICVYVRDCVQVIPAYPLGGDTSAGSFGNGHATSVT